MEAKRVFFEGRVQGVGFRFQTKQLAKEYEVVGWVRNLPDGRVELRAMGEEDELEAFLRAIGESSLAHHIQNRTVETIPPLEAARGFSIR